MSRLPKTYGPNENPLEETWKFSMRPENLPSGRHEIKKLAALSFFSGVAGLYGFLAYDETQGDALWFRWSAVICSSICPALASLNSTNQVIIDRLARRIKNELRKFSRDPEHEGFLGITLAALICSLGLTTPAVHNPNLNNLYLQMGWVSYVAGGNTFLHYWPTDKIAISHPVFSLPVKPFVVLGREIKDRCSTEIEVSFRKFQAFKRATTDRLLQAICDNVDRVYQETSGESFEWNNFSGKPHQWLSFVKKDGAFSDIRKKLLIEFLETKSAHQVEQQPSCWASWGKKLLGHASYLTGATLVLLSCIGYEVDPFSTLQETGMSEPAAIGSSIPSVYLLGIMLMHIGGSNLEKDIARLASINRNLSFEKNVKTVLPAHAQFHSKLYGLTTLLNCYIAGFSPYAAVRMVKLHFGEASPLAKFFLTFAQVGITYLSLASVGEYYRYCTAKFAALNEVDANHAVLEFQEMIGEFKRYIFNLEPDAIVHSLRQYSEERLKVTLGDNFFGDKSSEQISFKSKFEKMVDFENRFKEISETKCCSTAGMWSSIRRTPVSDLENPLLINATSNTP